MTTAAIDIANDALMLLGNNTITSLTESSRAARLCNQFYQRAVDATLRAYTWNCATVRSAKLSASATAPKFGFDYKYPLPSDCLRVLSMQDESYVFRVENGYLLTDESEAYVLYIKRIEAGAMDALLAEAVAARLAATIAFSLTNSTSAQEAAWAIYKAKIDEAQTVDAFESSPVQMASDDWINSRI